MTTPGLEVPDTVGLLGHYDAFDAFPSLNDGDSISNWPDKSGSGNDLPQATGIKQPIFKQLGVNVARFDGSNDVLDASIPAFEVNDFSLFMVAKTNSGAIGTLFAAQFQIPSPNGSGFGVFIRDADPNTKLNLNINGASLATVASPSGSVQIGTLHQITCIKNGATATIYVDGSQVATGTVPATILYPGALRRSSIGALISGGSFAFFFNGDSPETLLYGIAKNSSQQSTIEDYLKTKNSTP